MSNDFQIWLRKQGFTREHDTWGVWMKNGEIVSGKLLHDKFEEWKNLKT